MDMTLSAPRFRIIHREAAPHLLVVAPTPTLVRDTLDASGLSTDGGWQIRMVTRFMGLRGWRHGMPVLAIGTSQWATLAGHQGKMLEHTLMTLIACGRLRVAQDADLDAVRWEG